MRFAQIFLFICLLPIVATAADKLEIHDAWARETPPKASVTAGYLTLYNPSPEVYTLVRLSSPDFKRVEMHRTEQHDGMHKMLPVPQLTLSSKGRVTFQPGGMHLMLISPKKRLKAGDNVTLALFFSDGSSMKIALPVKKTTANTDRTMHNNQHDSHSQQH